MRGRASHVARDLTAIGSTVFNCCGENQHAAKLWESRSNIRTPCPCDLFEDSVFATLVETRSSRECGGGSL